MGVKQEDRPKLIGLLVGIVGLIVYMLIFVVPRFSRAQAAPDATKPASDAQATTAAAAPAPAPAGAPVLPAAPVPIENAPAKSESAQAGSAPSDVTKDPFISPVPPTVPGQAPGAHPTAAAPAPAPPTRPVVPAAVPVPAVFAPTAPMAGLAPVAPAASAPPPLVLMGTVGGKTAVAVFQQGEAFFEKQTGDYLPGGSRLMVIDDEGVLLAQKGKVYRLMVGSSDMQKSAAPLVRPKPAPASHTAADLADRQPAPPAAGVAMPLPNQAAASSKIAEPGAPKLHSPSQIVVAEGSALGTTPSAVISPYLADAADGIGDAFYRVQLGTFKSQAPADLIVKAAQDNGFEAEVRKSYSNRQTYYTILHSTHETRDEAEQEGQRLRSAGFHVYIANPPKVALKPGQKRLALHRRYAPKGAHSRVHARRRH